MEKEHISTVLLLSVLLTFMCPVLGIIPLYHSIEAWKKNTLIPQHFDLTLFISS